MVELSVLDEAAKLCYSAVFSDVCDRLGERAVTADPRIMPMAAVRDTMVGWARTARSVAVEDVPARPYGTEIDYIDSLTPGDVVVLRVEAPAAAWGELFSTAAQARGARGAVVDGLVRDRARIEATGFPVFGTGARPVDSLGRVSIAEQDEPVDCGGVRVRTGDLVVADVDGVTFVPRRLAEQAVSLALDKAKTENTARDLLRRGAYLRDAWNRYGVL